MDKNVKEINENVKRMAGVRLKSLREAKGWSQRDLANAAKVSVQTVRRIEDDDWNWTIDNLIACSNVLGVSIDEFFKAESSIEITKKLLPGFGRRVRKYRQARGLSQSDLGKIVDVSHAEISLIETEEKEPNFERRNRISNALEVPVDVLFRTDEPVYLSFEGAIDLLQREHEELQERNELIKGIKDKGAEDILQAILDKDFDLNLIRAALPKKSKAKSSKYRQGI